MSHLILNESIGGSPLSTLYSRGGVGCGRYRLFAEKPPSLQRYSQIFQSKKEAAPPVKTGWLNSTGGRAAIDVATDIPNITRYTANTIYTAEDLAIPVSMNVLGFVSCFSLVTGTLNMKEGWAMWKSAKKTHNVWNQTMAAIKGVQGALGAAFGSVMVPIRTMNVLKISSSSLSGLGTASGVFGLGLYLCVAARSTLQLGKKIQEHRAMKREIQGLDTPDQKIAYLEKQLELTAEEKTQLAEELLEHLEKGEAFDESSGDSLFLAEANEVRQAALSQTHTHKSSLILGSAPINTWLSHRVAAVIGKKEEKLKDLMGAEEMEKLKSAFMEYKKAQHSLIGVEACISALTKVFQGACDQILRRMALDAAVLLGAVIGVVSSVLAFCAGSQVAIAAWALCTLSALVFATLDLINLKKEFSQLEDGEMKKRIALLLVTALLLTATIAATAFTGGAAGVGIAVGAMVIWFASNAYVQYKWGKENNSPTPWLPA